MPTGLHEVFNDLELELVLARIKMLSKLVFKHSISQSVKLE
jgi:hypothetical protein